MGDGEVELTIWKESDFWLRLKSIDYISNLVYYEDFDLDQKAICGLWKKNGCDGLAVFQNKLNKKIFELFQPKVAEVFIITTYKRSKEASDFRYISNDGFIDFRAWIVSLGKECFEQFCNFESERDLINFDLNAEFAYRDDIPFFTSAFCRTVLNEDLKCKDLLKFGYNGDFDELHKKMLREWDALAMKYPSLYQKYQFR